MDSYVLHPNLRGTFFYYDSNCLTEQAEMFAPDTLKAAIDVRTDSNMEIV